MFSDRIMESEDEFFYRKADKIESKIQIPVEYTIAMVNAKFVEQLEQEEYENKKLLEERLLESWGSYKYFLNKSVAFVAIHQKRIVAVIVGTARFHNIVPIDIETEEQHRKKGLASALTQCFVNECIDNQLIAQWNCVDSNIASKRTAQKAGFKFMKKKPYYWFNI
jgi:RimJ/RimL family protein N-acetyltransferase